MKIVTIIGARPQFIKAALLSERIAGSGKGRKRITEVIVNTGQHYDYNMSKKFFEELNIPRPDYDLNIGPGPYAIRMKKMLGRIETVLIKEEPDAVLVYGDTNSTLAGALAAAKIDIPLCHVEAGLRSYDKSMPEENNRLVADNLSSVLFCPTREAVRNLKKENIRKGVYLVGDIMYELAVKMAGMAEKNSGILNSLGLKGKKYILVTVHREANTDKISNLRSIVTALCNIKNTMVFPVHPRTKKMLKKFKLWKKLKDAKNIRIVPPVGYFDMLCLEKNAYKIITDSGGVQKEAYFFKVPCITLRQNTEWVETLNNGWNVLVGTDAKKIVSASQKAFFKKNYINHYGDGKTSDSIVRIIKRIGCG